MNTSAFAKRAFGANGATASLRSTLFTAPGVARITPIRKMRLNPLTTHWTNG